MSARNFPQLNTAIKIQREWRRQCTLEQIDFQQPSQTPALLYALTELGEATDMYLREQRPKDNRANIRTETIKDELCDTAIMLIDAYQDLAIWNGYKHLEHIKLEPKTFAIIAIHIANAIATSESERDLDQENTDLNIFHALQLAFHLLGMLVVEPRYAIRERLIYRLKKIGADPISINRIRSELLVY